MINDGLLTASIEMAGYKETKNQLHLLLRELAICKTASTTDYQADRQSAGDDANFIPTSRRWVTVRDFALGLAETVARDTFQVAVIGEYSGGKSSLLNVLLRLHDPQGKKTDGLLPTAITPTTAVITEIHYADHDTIQIVLKDGRKLRADPQELKAYLSTPDLRRKKFLFFSQSEKKEQIASQMREVHIGCNSPLLAQGVRLVDTPGLGSIHKEHAEITQAYITEIDAALFLVSVDPPMGEQEMTFLQYVANVTDKFVFIQTKRDLGDRLEQGRPVWEYREAEHRNRIAEVLKRDDFPLFSVSAMQAASALRQRNEVEFEGSGFVDLERHLKHFLVSQRGAPRLMTWLARVGRAIDLTRMALDERIKSLDARVAKAETEYPSSIDKEMWRKVEELLESSLTANLISAERKLSEREMDIHKEVVEDAERELKTTSPAELHDNPDRCQQIERAMVRSIQDSIERHLRPVMEDAHQEADKALRQALGAQLPQSYRRFQPELPRSQETSVLFAQDQLVGVRTVIRKEKREGFWGGITNFMVGLKEVEVTEKIFKKDVFEAAIDRGMTRAVRSTRDSIMSSLRGGRTAARDEMARIIRSADEAQARDREIRQQTTAQCEAQCAEAEAELTRLTGCQEQWKEIEARAIELREASDEVYFDATP